MEYKVKHHQVIKSALENLNADFFFEHNILFGGGTRIALELSEFRESIDIDFLCPDKVAYRAVREQVSNTSLGHLVKEDFVYARDIRFDRDGVRTIIDFQGTKIKMEFVSFDNYTLSSSNTPGVFPIPYLDQVSCFYTKLLANADRHLVPPYKDAFDLLAMYKEWGSLPQRAITLAEEHYGQAGILPPLMDALQDIIAKPSRYEKVAESLKMNRAWIQDIVYIYPEKLLKELMTKQQ